MSSADAGWRAWLRRLPALPVRPRLLLACLEIYLILSLNLFGALAEGRPGRKFIKVRVRRRAQRNNESTNVVARALLLSCIIQARYVLYFDAFISKI